MTHTKGNWEFKDNGNTLTILAPQKGPVRQYVGLVYDTENEEERVANAQLISAAPEMYEALENIENDANQVPKHVWGMITKALKKARGEK